MSYEILAMLIGSLLLGVLLAVGAWKLLKGALVLGLVLVLSVALYVGSFFAVSSAAGDEHPRTRTFVHTTLLPVYAPLRMLDVVRFGKDGFVWR